MKLYFVKDGEVVECECRKDMWNNYYHADQLLLDGTPIVLEKEIGIIYHTTPAAAIQAEVERAFKKTESLYAEYQSAAKGETQIRFWSQQKLAELGEKGEGKC